MLTRNIEGKARRSILSAGLTWMLAIVALAIWMCIPETNKVYSIFQVVTTVLVVVAHIYAILFFYHLIHPCPSV